MIRDIYHFCMLAWGKVRRELLATLFRDRARYYLEYRRGACLRCGACCKLLFKCPAYDESDGEPKCLIHDSKPGVCTLFPINEVDIKDRDLVMPERRCGFYFVRDNGQIDQKTNSLLHSKNGFKGTIKILKYAIDKILTRSQ